MLKIKMEDADALYGLFVQLGAITYLQSLMQLDIIRGTCDEELCFAQRTAEHYLLDWQSEIVIKLKNLLEREDFTVYEK